MCKATEIIIDFTLGAAGGVAPCWSRYRVKHLAILACSVFDSHDLALFCLDHLVARKAVPADLPSGYVDALPAELRKS